MYFKVKEGIVRPREMATWQGLNPGLLSFEDQRRNPKPRKAGGLQELEKTGD